MAHDIIMPMLGMAQETGTIVSWRKKPGDPVKATDIVMEVETDKATVEIEAGHDGFLTAVTAEIGIPIPVGQVVAIVSDERSGAETPPAEEPKVQSNAAPVPETAPVSPAPSVSAPPPAKPSAFAPQVAGADGRILASPKARRLAEERGIDLRRLVRLGAVQPLHVSDLESARRQVSTASAAHSILRASVGRRAFEDFLGWIRQEAEIPLDALNVWAAFAAGAYRKAVAPDSDVVIHASRVTDDLETVALRNPDQVNLSAIAPAETTPDPAVSILDLTGTAFVDYQSAGESSPLRLTIANGQSADTLDITLVFEPDILPLRSALILLKDLTARVEQPLRHLI